MTPDNTAATSAKERNMQVFRVEIPESLQYRRRGEVMHVAAKTASRAAGHAVAKVGAAIWERQDPNVLTATVLVDGKPMAVSVQWAGDVEQVPLDDISKEAGRASESVPPWEQGGVLARWPIDLDRARTTA